MIVCFLGDKKRGFWGVWVVDKKQKNIPIFGRSATGGPFKIKINNVGVSKLTLCFSKLWNATPTTPAPTWSWIVLYKLPTIFKTLLFTPFYFTRSYIHNHNI